jgi:exonuclease VII small subunit
MRLPLRFALTQPWNLLALCGALLAGLFAAWWLGLTGLALYGLLVYLTANDPAVRARQSLRQRAPLARRFDGPFDQVARAQIHLYNALAQSSPRMREVLQPVQAAVGDLVEEAYRIGVQVSVLENHRQVSRARDDPQKALAAVERKIAAAADPVVRFQYEESRRALEERQVNLDEVNRQLERTEALYASLTSALESTLTEVIRVQTLSPEQAQGRVPDLVHDLEQRRMQLAEFANRLGEL